MSALHPIFRGIFEDFGMMRPTSEQRPPEPSHGTEAWYRGWECGYDDVAASWGAEGWRAAKGGWDLDCRQTSGRTWVDLLDEIDAEEGGE